MIKNTLTKIILSFLLIVFLLLSLSVYGISSASRTLQSQIYNTVSENTKNVTSNLNTTLSLLHTQNSSLISQSSILKLAKTSFLLDKYEKISLINQIREQLTSIADSSPFVERVCIYFHQLERVYNSNTNPGGSFHEFTSEQYEQILSSVSTSGGPVCYWNPITGQENFSLFIYSYESKNDCMIEIILSQNAIRNYFESNSFFGRDYYYATIFDQIVMTNLPESILTNFDTSDFSDTTVSGQQYSIDGNSYFYVTEEIPFISCNYFRIVSADEYLTPLVTTTQLTIVIFVAVFVGSLLFLFLAYHLFHMPLQKLMKGFKLLEKGDFTVQLPSDKSADFNYIYQSFNSMTQNLAELIDREYKMKLLLQKAEFKQLQSQINPHFLYNNFFLLKRAIKDGLYEDAEKMASLLGQYFRYITRNSVEQVPLKDEYYHAVLYSELQSLRFEGRIRILLDPLPAEYESLAVPKLILQPIMENAFLHGLDHKISDGILSMKFIPAKDSITILIEDNSDQLSDAELSELNQKMALAESAPNTLEMTGILNIKRRISLYSNYQSQLTLSRSSMGGLCVSITLAVPK